MNVEIFLKRLQDGSIPVLAESLEDMGWLGDPDLETIGMRYLHGECHVWTQALQDLVPTAEIGVVMAEETGIAHSFLIIPETGKALDAGGLWDVETLRVRWEELMGEDCTIEKITREALENWDFCEEDEIEDAQADFSLWVEFSRDAWEAAPRPGL